MMYLKITVFSIIFVSFGQPYTSGYGIVPDTASDCPNPYFVTGSQSCSSDYHCGGGEKCCPNRIGYTVCTPIMPVNNEKPGQCPKYGPECYNAQTCLNDYECPGDKKCCFVGFWCKVCVNPVHLGYAP